jgi:hypothetical protein
LRGNDYVALVRYWQGKREKAPFSLRSTETRRNYCLLMLLEWTDGDYWKHVVGSCCTY